MGKHLKKWNILLFLAPILFLIVAILVVLTVSANSIYPTGSDVMYHIYRGHTLFESIKGGNWWPLLDPMWYNGVELMRYWAPLPAFFLAACEWIGGGSPLEGYLIFVGLICFLGALPWLYIGRKAGRPWLGMFLGVLWFFMPNNLLALFTEGNLARSICMIFLPLFIFQNFEYLKTRNWKLLPAITLWFVLILLCHLGYAGMVALSMLLFFVIYGIFTKTWRPILDLIGAMAFGFLALGIWALPSLIGGITGLDNSENMINFFQTAWISLNPLERYQSDNGNFYFGLAALILALFGGFFSHRKSAAGFWTAVVIFLCTTTALYPILRRLPGSQYLWMLRFISIALCLILISFLFWDRLKKPLVILICVLLCLDTIPSLRQIYGYGDYNTMLAEERLDYQQNVTLIRNAQGVTKQRLALMDESTLGSLGAWLVSAWGSSVPGTYGAGWEAAVTSSNISQLNRALTSGSYYYLFDRCLELGNDTVLIRLSRLPQSEKEPEAALDAAAAAVGYEPVKVDLKNTGYRLYHLNTGGNFGTVNTYRAIAIGNMASSLALQFPAMQEADSEDLSDYTFEELSRYDLIYLAGFTCYDRAYAEKLITDLSEAGVRIVIAADGIPEDRQTHDQSFLGVRCNFIEFKNGYPELDTIDGILYTDLFPDGYTDWKTVYLDGLDNSWGTLRDGDLALDFYGTVKNDNIVMIALNLTYFYGVTRDPAVGELLSHAMDLSAYEIPKREIVPLTVDYTPRSITIASPKENVCTTLAYHDIFDADKPIEEVTNLTVVGEGTTRITLRYPYLWQGALLSLLGVSLLIAQWILRRKYSTPKPAEEKPAEEGGSEDEQREDPDR